MIKRIIGYIRTWFRSKAEAAMDPEIEIEQAIDEARNQDQALRSQAAKVIAHRTKLEDRIERSADDVAAYLRTSRSWVYKAAADGTLPSVRIGSVLRFLPASVEALVNTQHTPKGGTP